MTRNEQLALVIRLACLTEHRTNDEQRALIRWAWDCDVAHNKNTTSNAAARQRPGWELQNLVAEVMTSRKLDADYKDRPVPPPTRWEERWARWLSELDELVSAGSGGASNG